MDGGGDGDGDVVLLVVVVFDGGGYRAVVTERGLVNPRDDSVLSGVVAGRSG